MTDDSGSEDYVSMEYEIPLAMDGVPNLFAPHRLLFDFLKLDQKDVVLVKIFRIFAGLCDPMTQPEDTDTLPLSVDLLARVAIALCYDVVLQGRREEDPRPWQSGEQADLVVDVETIRFTLSTKFYLIVLAIGKAIRADDELRVQYLQNDLKDWRNTRSFWLPDLDHDQLDLLLKLAYYVYAVALMGLYRLFLPADEANFNAALNPYLETFIRLWKIHTDIVGLCIQMDRDLEEEAWTNNNDSIDTPDLVKRVLWGSSAARSVLSWILERQPPPMPPLSEAGDHDIRSKTLLTFFDPLARVAGGCVSSDQYILMVALLLLRCRSNFSPCQDEANYSENIPFPSYNSKRLLRRIERRLNPLQATGDLVVDIYYRDQLDEDIKYIFGYYESDDDNESARSSGADSLARRGIAIRATGDEQEFDEEGRDWRDCPRGENVEFTPEFLKLELQMLKLTNHGESDYFFASWFELSQALEFLAFTLIESVDSFMIRVGQVAIDSIARAVKDENTHTESKIVIKEIYRYLVTTAKLELLVRANEDFTVLPKHPVSNFEMILFRNPHCALAILDELFMCNGLRRSLIWFLTNHVNPLMTLISYMYEFVAGLRGNNPKRDMKYSFSRKGALVVSKMEQLMMLHELFSAADKWLSEEDQNTRIGDLMCARIVSYLCLMIKRLLEDGIIRSDQTDVYEDYSHEIQLLLFNWIGKVPEAREIFFKIKLEKYGVSHDAAQEEKTGSADSGESQDTPAAATKDDSNDTETPNGKELVKQLLGFIDEFKSLDENTYVGREPEARAVFAGFADILADIIQRVYEKKERLIYDAKISDATRVSEFEAVLVFLQNFNEISKNLNFWDQIETRLDGWIVDTREDLEEITEFDESLIPTEAEVGEPQGNLATEAVDSEFSEAFLNGEGSFQKETKSNKSNKKKKKKRGKK